MKVSAIALTVGLIAGAPGLSPAQTAADLNGQVTTMNELTTNPGQTNVVGKISGDFNPPDCGRTFDSGTSTSSSIKSDVTEARSDNLFLISGA